MATVAAPALKVVKESKLAKYRALRSSVDTSSYGDGRALKEEGRKIDEAFREERTIANGLLLKSK